MLGSHAGAFSLSPSFLSSVRLPFGKLSIDQDRRYQSVTHASDFLQQEVIRLYLEPRLRVLELGSGCGIVSIMLALQRPAWQITGIDIQAEEVALATANALKCKVKVKFITADLRTWNPAEDFDLIISNPPWQPLNSGKASPLLTRRLGREELSCTMSDVLDAAERLSGETGEALIIYPITRRADMEQHLQKSSLDTIQVLHSSDFKLYFISQTRKRGR